MKILAIGDFHGECPVDIKQVCVDNKIDVIISPGDFCPFTLRKLFFAKIYLSNRYPSNRLSLQKLIGKKQLKKINLQDIARGIKILEELNKAKLPVFVITGNNDKYENPSLAEAIKQFKNIKLLDFTASTHGGFSLLGLPRSSAPERWIVRKGKFSKVLRKGENYDKKFAKLNSLFDEKPTIFVSHSVPFNTKLDIIGQRAHKNARGKHYGSELARRVIDKYQPLLCICGHIHETQGVDHIGKTAVVNSGFGAKGEYAIIELTEDKVKDVKLVRGEKWK